MLTTTVHHGHQAVSALRQHGHQIDRQAVAFCQRSHWLIAAAQHTTKHPAVIVTVAGDGALAGFLAVQASRRRGITRVAGLGGEWNDYPPYSAATPDIADTLAGALIARLSRPRRWLLDLGQVDASDPLANQLLRRLPGASSTAGDVMPRLVGLTPELTISRARRKALAQARNRLTKDGHDWTLNCSTGGEGLQQTLAAIVALRRGRDHWLGRRSHLDSGANRAFYTQVVTGMVSDRRADLHTLSVDGQLAGYAVCIRDGAVHRLWDGRVAVGMERYSAGRLCAHAALEQAMNDPAVYAFDWLRGQSAEKIHNQQPHRWQVHAASGAWLDRADHGVDAIAAAARGRTPAALRRALVTRL